MILSLRTLYILFLFLFSIQAFSQQTDSKIIDENGDEKEENKMIPILEVGGVTVFGYYGLAKYNHWQASRNPKYKSNYLYANSSGIENLQNLENKFVDVIHEYNAFITVMDKEYPHLITHLMGSGEINYRVEFEDDLVFWVMDQKDNSITPELIFKKAIQYSDGDIGKALLGIHNAIRKVARYQSNYINNYLKVNEDFYNRFFNKFIDIRGDLVEAGGNGDHPGSWYRLFGVILSTYHSSIYKKNGIIRKNLTLTAIKQLSLGVTAEVIKPLISFPERDLSGKLNLNILIVKLSIKMMQKLKKNPTLRMTKNCLTSSLM